MAALAPDETDDGSLPVIPTDVPSSRSRTVVTTLLRPLRQIWTALRTCQPMFPPSSCC